MDYVDVWYLISRYFGISKMYSVWFSFFEIYWDFFWPVTWSILVNIPTAVIEYSVLWVLIWSSWFIVIFKSIQILTDIWLLLLSVAKRRLLKSLVMIVQLWFVYFFSFS